MPSITAHPYVVMAEHQWRSEQLGGANLAPRRRRSLRLPQWHLPRPSRRMARTAPRAL